MTPVVLAQESGGSARCVRGPTDTKIEVCCGFKYCYCRYSYRDYNSYFNNDKSHCSEVAYLRAKNTPDGVLFVVCNRIWTWISLPVLGIIFILLGVIFIIVAVGSYPVEVGMTIAGIGLVVSGPLLLWLAHCLKRARLEVLPDSTVRVTGMVHATHTVSLRDATELRPFASQLGGVDVREGRVQLLTAAKGQLGYGQLIEFIGRTRPDLELPEECWPL